MKNVMRACVGALAHTMVAVTSGTWEANVGYEWVWLGLWQSRSKHYMFTISN
jgi:hypothetical protein